MSAPPCRQPVQQVIVDWSPPHNGTATSKAAAESIRAYRGRHLTKIFTFIEGRGFGGATRDEIERELHIGGNTVRPRVKELIELGTVKELEAQRKTKSGRNAFILVARKYVR